VESGDRRLGPPKAMAGPICLWLSRLLLGVGACFNFMGPHDMYGLGPYTNQVWRVYGVLVGFSHVGCTMI
jgi:hypothetical protein